MRKTVRYSLAIVAALCSMAAVSPAQSVSTHHVREEINRGEAPYVERMSPTQVLQLDLVLPLRDPAGLKQFVSDVNNPKSPVYQHFLTPAEFTERFGPTQEQYDELLDFARSHDLQIAGGSRDGMLVQVKGSVAAIETAFHLSMANYLHPTEDRVFYGPDREPTTDLPFNLWHISGLDNFSTPHARYSKRSDAEARKETAVREGRAIVPLATKATTGSGPSSSFLGSDIRAAYYGGTALTGAGQTVGLWEYYGTDLADVTTYYKNAKQTNNVPITLLSTDGTSTSCLYTRAGKDCDDTEQTLDITQALGAAPGLAGLVVFIGSTDTSIISSISTHTPLAATIGCSWGWTPDDPTTLDPYFEKLAAQGQNFFAASGDDSTWSSRNEAWPADDAYVVSVGGTDLTTASAGGAWKSETAWSDSGGGISPDKIAIPSWQKLSGVITSTNKGSTTYRNGPDVAANANFTYYVCADQKACTANEYGGTSFAAPFWAGFIALVNQQRVANGKSTLGFLNSYIYAENVTAATYKADFHDITSGKSGSYSAVTGYDLVTGWGSPTATLITELVAQ